MGAVAIIAIALVAVSIAAMLLFRPKVPGQESNRDLEVSDSAYGNFINIGRGRVRLVGDLCYARDLIEVVKESGGKGGSPSQKTYSYFLTGIYLMGAASIFGPVKSFVKVWADNELIYDITGTQQLDVKEDVTLRFMYGTEDQEPDTIQVEDEGNLAQGFPFSICIVLDNFPLKYSADRPPTLSAEVDFENENVSAFTILTSPDTGTDDPTPGWYFIDYDRNKIYSPLGPGSSYNPRTTLMVFNTTALEEIDTLDISINIRGAMELRGFDAVTGYLFGWHQYDPGVGADHVSAYVYDPNTEAMITDIDFPDENFSASPSDFINQHYPIARSANGSHAVVFSGDLGSQSGYRNNAHDFPGLTHHTTLSTPEPGLTEGSPPGPKWANGSYNGKHKSDTVWAAWVSFDNIRFYSYKLNNADTIETTIYSDIHRTVLSATLYFTRDSLEWTPIFDESDDTILLHVTMGVYDGPSVDSFIFKWDPATQSVVWSTLLDNVFLNQQVCRYNTRLNGGFYRIQSGGQTYKINLATGAISDEENITSSQDSEILSDSWSYDGINHCYYTAYNATLTFGGYKRYCFPSADESILPVADVIREVCTRVGLIEGTDFDVSNVSETTWGWKLTDKKKANEALLDAMQPYFIEVSSVDGLLNFHDRNETSIKTISIDDFIMPNKREELPYSITTEDESTLPRLVEINYADPYRDYEPGQALYRRPQFPDLSFLTYEDVTHDTPYAMKNLTAKNQAYRWTYIPWLERETIKGKLSHNYLDLVGTDVVTFDFGAGNLEDAKIMKANILQDFSIEIEAVFLKPGATQAASFAATSGIFNRVSEIVAVPDSTLYYLSINLLRDEDDLNNVASLQYLGVRESNPPVDPYDGATVYKSVDQIDYDVVAELPVGVIVGTAITALPTITDPFGTKLDDTIDLKVLADGDQLASVTYQALLNGANGAVALKNDGSHEIFQYMTVTDLGNDTYRLTGLLRGRRGTDTMIGNNAIGDTIIFVSPSTIRKNATQFTRLGLTDYFRPVTSGQQFNDAVNQIESADGSDLKPYAPTYFAVARDGSNNLDISFRRRTRYGSGFILGDYKSPLNEAVESYEIDVYDGTGVTVLRTLTGSTTTIQYSIGDQTTDGFSGSETQIWIEVFQISSIVGRGYSYKLQVDIN